MAGKRKRILTRTKPKTAKKLEPQEPAPRTVKTVIVAGVEIPAAMQWAKRLKKECREGTWVLVARNGSLLAAFNTETDADNWLLEFRKHRNQNRPKKAKMKRGQPTGHRAPESASYLLPWSKEYDMPDYDLE